MKHFLQVWGSFLVVFGLVTLVLVACGSGSTYEDAPAPSPDAPIDSLVSGECGRCHASQLPRITTAADLVRVGAKDEINSGHMPPDRRLSAETKKRLSDAARSTK